VAEVTRISNIVSGAVSLVVTLFIDGVVIEAFKGDITGLPGAFMFVLLLSLLSVTSWLSFYIGVRKLFESARG
jgi:hypothetical protein